MDDNADSNLCNDQDTFNDAVRQAVKYTEKQADKELSSNPWTTVYAIIHLIFLVWGVILAMRIKPQHERIEHLIFAILFSPLYVLAYYLSDYSEDRGTMGMCGSCHGSGCGM